MDDEINNNNKLNSDNIRKIIDVSVTLEEKCPALLDFDPEYLRSLLESADELAKILPGFHVPLPDTAEIPPLPSWVNIEMVKKGQQFGLKYLYGLNYSQTLSLLYLFAAPDGLQPLIFTERSHTPFLAHKRYLSTALRVNSWYETEFWKPSTSGYDNLKSVKTLHLHVSKRLSEIPESQLRSKCNLEEKLRRDRECQDIIGGGGMTTDGMLCPLRPILRVDFEKNPNYNAPFAYFDKIMRSSSERRIYLNQFEMSVTQFGFFGLMLMYPEKFGARNATDEELECFVHMWKLIGYLLGVKNEYNFCDGSLAQVKVRGRQFIDLVMRPMVVRVNKEWEHMSRVAFLGIEKFTKLRINFESTMLYFCWVLNIPTPNLMQYVGWKEISLFRVTKFVMTEGCRIPGFATLFNYRITKNIEKAAVEFHRSKNKSKESSRCTTEQRQTFRMQQFD
ncbi:uncharacterized protein LOC135831392 [Planococcus citri]|uniref:uncharacterized protein LOC135831392 n=1 Tax=Planococcus citri TaxID=170843 RepID=UPI0031F824F6